MNKYMGSVAYLGCYFFVMLMYVIIHSVRAKILQKDARYSIRTIFYLSAFVTAVISAAPDNCIISRICLLSFVIAYVIFGFAFHIRDLQGKRDTAIETVLFMISLSMALLWMIKAVNLITFYLAIELYTLSIFALGAFGDRRRIKMRLESVIKYFVISTLMSCTYLMGVALLYSAAHDFTFIAVMNTERSPFFILGAILMIMGLCGKIAAGPFHFWAPAFYRYAANHVFLLSGGISKFVLVCAIIKILSCTLPDMSKVLHLIGVISLIIGAFGGLEQRNVRGILAYGGIGHIGFILLGVSDIENIASLHYIFVYVMINFMPIVSAFVYLKLQKIRTRELSDIVGMYRKSGFYVFIIAVMLFSMAGVPPFPGFFAKMLIIRDIIQEERYVELCAVIITSILSCFYYIRLIGLMFFKQNKQIISMRVSAFAFNVNPIFLFTLISLGINLTYFMYYDKICLLF